ncbi:DUF6055 domain-containing protein [Thalassobellus citreus]|uniref:DUF6055 domain-containing protein n=1 Tax=Thalassobellus citreus TaxID=3367752 RepID=UPI0037B7958E
MKQKNIFNFKHKILLFICFFTLINISVVDAQELLTGSVIWGPTGPGIDSGNNGTGKPFDGVTAADDLGNFFEIWGKDGENDGWIGLELANSAIITKVRVFPRGMTEVWTLDRIKGGTFEGANSSDFSDAVVLATVSDLPNLGNWTEFTVSIDQNFKYIRYKCPDLSTSTTGPTASLMQISELEFYGTEIICTPEPISLITTTTLNGNVLQQTYANVLVGETVKFNVEVSVGDISSSAKWSGPNNFNATSLSITLTNVDASDSGEYTFSYINSCLKEVITTFDLLVRTSTEKEVYIPKEWDTNDKINYDLVNRAAQSDNILLVWGDVAGSDPVNAPDEDIRFNPQQTLDSLEVIYNYYVKDLKLVEEKGVVAKYKMVVVMNNTWGPDVFTGWAFGGSYDDTVPAFWVDPRSIKNNYWVAAHEMTHSFQTITPVLYPGHGYTNVTSSGFFWETHANFMAIQSYPQGILWSDYTRALNFTNYFFGSARKHYGDWFLLQYLKDKYGIDFIGRMWRESNPGSQEHPIQTIQRLLNLSNDGMANLMADYGRRRINGDFSNKSYIKAAEDELEKKWVWRQTQILDSIGTNHYAIPDNLAPQQYAFNTIRLYPQTDANCSNSYIHLKLKGHEVNDNTASWKFSFVSVDASGVSTFSEIYDDGEINYEVPADSDKLFLVVTGVPTDFYVHIGKFEIGFPKLYRFPWEINIEGAIPEGYQQDFRIPTNIAGAPHSNGGGFVANTARVDATAYVGPHAVVLDYARITGLARIEGKAIITGNSTISGNAIVKDFARVRYSQVKDNAVISEYAYLIENNVVTGDAQVRGNSVIMNNKINENAKIYGNAFSVGNENAYGDIEIGGDAEIGGSCNTGKYLQTPNVLERKSCDGNFNSEIDIDINSTYNTFTSQEISFSKQYQCGKLGIDDINETNTFIIYPNPSDKSSIINIKLNNKEITNYSLEIINLNGQVLYKKENCKTHEQFSSSKLAKGIYFISIKAQKFYQTKKIIIQ